MKVGNGALPTTSSKAASLLGARPISSATYQARSNGFAITPDSSAPNTPPAASYQASPAALPPPMGFSQPSQQRTSSTMSGLGSLQPLTSGPNYNSVLTPTAPMSGSFPSPLQPYSSSAFTSPPAVHAPSYVQPHPQVAQASGFSPAIQWNNAPMQPAASPQPPEQQSQPNFGSVLQPTKKETSFDWSDLDPMR